MKTKKQLTVEIDALQKQLDNYPTPKIYRWTGKDLAGVVHWWITDGDWCSWRTSYTLRPGHIVCFSPDKPPSLFECVEGIAEVPGTPAEEELPVRVWVGTLVMVEHWYWRENAWYAAHNQQALLEDGEVFSLATGDQKPADLTPEVFETLERVTEL